jgi:hypothetical protein
VQTQWQLCLPKRVRASRATCAASTCMDRWGSIGCGLEAVAYWRVATFLVLRHGRQGLCWCSARRVHRHCHRAASGLVVHGDGDGLYLAASIISPMRLACVVLCAEETLGCVCVLGLLVGGRARHSSSSSPFGREDILFSKLLKV